MKPSTGGLLDRFASTVCDLPSCPAVIGSDGTLSFAELDTRSARLAAALRATGVRPGQMVGVSLPRGTAQVVALLGTWRVGAAYVPLDPVCPAERLAFMAADANVGTLVATATPTWAAGLDTVTPDADTALDTDLAISDRICLKPQAPAYVIYTSGSTGRPKGVEVSYGSVEHLVTAYERCGLFGREPRVVALNASISFDASVHWVRVCRGDTIVVLDDEHRMDPHLLRSVLEQHAVTDLDLTPTHWEILRAALLPPFADGRTLRLFVGGEPIPTRTWRAIAETEGLDGFNMYGPTECTVDVTAAPIKGTNPSLGRPLPDNEIHLLDDDLRPAPDDGVGEMFVTSPRLAARYVGRPGLTAARFLPSPFGGSGKRMYRTGDRARRVPDGRLVFVGRADRQLKLRGFRIEPEEIEHHIGSYPGVARAVVVLDGEQLIAHVQPAGTPPPDGDDLADYLRRRVPAYMVPTRFVVETRLPMTGSDKTDSASLARHGRSRVIGDGWRLRAGSAQADRRTG